MSICESVAIQTGNSTYSPALNLYYRGSATTYTMMYWNGNVIKPSDLPNYFIRLFLIEISY